MSIAGAALGVVASTTSATSYATLSAYQPTSNALALAFVYNRLTGGATTPTFSGNGLTWVSITSRTMELGGTAGLLTLFRSMGASPTNTTGVADFGATSQDGCIVSVAQFTGVDTSGTHGSGAIVQSAIAQAGSGTALLVTLAVFANGSNATYGGFGVKTNTAGTQGADWTLLHNDTYATPNSSIVTQWVLGADATADATAGTSAEWGGIAVEIAISPAFPSQAKFRRGRRRA